MKFGKSHFCCCMGELSPTLEEVAVLITLPIYGDKNAMDMTLGGNDIWRMGYQIFFNCLAFIKKARYASPIRFYNEGE